MREIIARAVCALTVCVVVTLSLLFASVHNPRFGKPLRTIAVPSPATEEARMAHHSQVDRNESREHVTRPTVGNIDRGRAVYAVQNCAGCHAIAGVGNPRHPLDGAGARWNARQLAEWITGTGAAASELPAAIVKRKRQYQAISDDDFNALVAYLSSLKSERK